MNTSLEKKLIKCVLLNGKAKMIVLRGFHQKLLDHISTWKGMEQTLV